MSIVYGPNVGLMAGAADGDLYGDAMRAFQRGVDSFLMPTVDGYLINTPPASPVEGSFYIIGAAPSGDWSGHAGEMARWSSHVSDWDFYTPKNGWMAQSKNARETYRYTGGAWEVFYQEGGWTPGLTAASVAPSGITYSNRNGNYKKIGGCFLVRFGLQLSSKGTGGSGQARITGLPFSASSYASFFEPNARVFVYELTTASNSGLVTVQVASGSTVMPMLLSNNVASALDWSEITDATAFISEIFYD